MTPRISGIYRSLDLDGKGPGLYWEYYEVLKNRFKETGIVRKVHLNFTLVGKTRDGVTLVPSDWGNKGWLENVTRIVAGRFGERALFVADEARILHNSRAYPDFYAAGWFISNEAVESGNGSELVVIAHGSSMARAHEAMMTEVKNIDWLARAKDI